MRVIMNGGAYINGVVAVCEHQNGMPDAQED